MRGRLRHSLISMQTVCLARHSSCPFLYFHVMRKLRHSDLLSETLVPVACLLQLEKKPLFLVAGPISRRMLEP